MSLTEIKVRDAVRNGQKYRRLYDGLGLYLLVLKSGKYWRWDYCHAGKRKTLALGVYPEVSLEQARQAQLDARAVVKSGADPVALRRQGKRSAEAVINSPELALDLFRALSTEQLLGLLKAAGVGMVGINRN